MNLNDELRPLLTKGIYKGKTVAEIERIAGIGNGTLSKAYKANGGTGSIRTGLIEKMCAADGKEMSLVFKRVK